ncbi:MAG: hypothetical protein ACI4E1_00935 [Lachnospira sp.]
MNNCAEHNYELHRIEVEESKELAHKQGLTCAILHRIMGANISPQVK